MLTMNRPEIYVHIFHSWGLPSFEHQSDFKYDVWEGCAIFAHRYHPASGAEEVHMAMDPKNRHRCREAVKYMQGKFSKIVAICTSTNTNIKNLLTKCGFYEKGVVEEMTNIGKQQLRVMVWEA